MSFKSRLIKTAIKMTPNPLIKWVSNIILKDIAKLTDFNFDLDARTAYVQIQLAGEAEAIEVRLEDFAVINEDNSYHFIIQQARSNRLWLDNLLSRIVAKAWKIPVPAQMVSHMELVAELFKTESPEPEQID